MSFGKESQRRWQSGVCIAGLAVAVAFVAALLAMTAGIGSRFGWWTFRTGFTLLGYAAYGGCGAALLGIAAAVVTGRQRQLTGFALAVAAITAGVAVAAVPASWRLLARQLPAIHDISTDTLQPPEFVAVLPLRRDAPNPAAYGGPAVAAAQHRAYADLRTEVLNLSLGRAFEHALATARAAGWRIVAADPAMGRIEATDTTFWFGFRDDIVIRLVGAGERTLVDVRSVSRVGKSDVGTNARRIRAYLQRLRLQP